MAERHRAAGNGVGIAVLVHTVDVDSGKTVDHREGSCCPVTRSIDAKSAAVDVVYRPDPPACAGVQGKLVDGSAKPHIGLTTAVQDDGVGVGN